MLKRIAWLALLASVLTLSSACRKPSTAGNTTTSTAPASAAQDPKKPVPEQLPDVLARVDGEPITKADFEQHIAQIEMAARQQVPKEQRNEVYRKALDRLINIRLLKKEAHARNLPADEKVVEQQLQRIRGQFPTEEEYKKALTSRGLTPEKLRGEMLEETRINRMMEGEAAAVAPVTDAEIREFYEKNPEKFKQGESVRASHILIRVPSGDDAAKKKALATIQNLLKQAKSGKDFGDLARQHSNDSSAERGGDLGFFTKDRMVPEFANAAFALRPGEVSDVVETQFGYHIIKVLERRPATEVPLQQVTSQVREFLTRQRQQERAEAFVNRLRSKSRIEVLI